MRRLLVVLCILALSRGVLGQAAARESPPEPAREASEDIWKKCRGNEPDGRLTACSILIARGQDTPAELASAYYARGSAYRQKSLFALALQDFDAAITANPDLTDAYGDRGITLTILGRYTDAIPDFSRVIEVYPESVRTRCTTAGSAMS